MNSTGFFGRTSKQSHINLVDNIVSKYYQEYVRAIKIKYLFN